jgi:hypothetical protein
VNGQAKGLEPFNNGGLPFPQPRFAVGENGHIVDVIRSPLATIRMC